ncbi:arsenate reductase (glutaredoxin) [Thalassotalea sp. 1_MG-2023]|uniref:arsenate reductase (glutaredoxin) n=1 Tax=Thalassotalea sp. 1_MG-2023 TaxID=3062680 RepID=UPI0026E28AF6|nr:arsenate reductase (glutaredoxin) [Thalassotalea sp. 1_MG-2023]MDO6428405.1 arsenate reductase (glutaredoxin) [Thalassotalea sp. 1_MG-2023]
MLTIYHNPRCSKSRQTLQLLEQNNAEFTVVEYLKTPLNASEIKDLLSKLEVSAIEMMRTKEAEFKEQQLKDADSETLINAMANTPKLIERPIVVKQNKAVIGRPPENVLTLL